MAKRTGLQNTSLVLASVGAVNWGLVSAFDFNVVTALGLGSGFVSVVYIAVGLAGLYTLWSFNRMWIKKKFGM